LASGEAALGVLSMLMLMLIVPIIPPVIAA
jgi:hypothetical protein